MLAAGSVLGPIQPSTDRLLRNCEGRKTNLEFFQHLEARGDLSKAFLWWDTLVFLPYLILVSGKVSRYLLHIDVFCHFLSSVYSNNQYVHKAFLEFTL